MNLLDQYQTERDDLLTTISRALEGVEGRDLSDAETRSISDARARVESLNAQIDLVGGVNDLTRNLARSERREQSAATAEVRSLGAQFVESEAFTDYRGHGASGRVTAETRALPTGLTEIADVLPQAQRVDVTDPKVTSLLQVIPTVSVSSNSIEIVTMAKVAGGAAKVAEKAAKPSVEFAPTVTPITLDTLAAYTQLTRQLMEDAPAVRSMIDTELRWEITRVLEAETAAAIAAATLPAENGSTLLASIRKGVGSVQAAGFNPNAVLLHPSDWADLDIDVFTSTLNGPAQGRNFWGLTPISDNLQPQGTATVGDMRRGVQRYARTGVNLYITDSHADTFLANVFTLLAEARSKTVVTRPTALVNCTVV